METQGGDKMEEEKPGRELRLAGILRTGPYAGMHIAIYTMRAFFSHHSWTLGQVGLTCELESTQPLGFVCNDDLG
jgi:hypothetical protein